MTKILIHVPKSGGMTILKAGEEGGIKVLHKAGLRGFLESTEEEIESCDLFVSHSPYSVYLKRGIKNLEFFSLVRCPYTRIISNYYQDKLASVAIDSLYQYLNYYQGRGLSAMVNSFCSDLSKPLPEQLDSAKENVKRFKLFMFSEMNNEWDKITDYIGTKKMPLIFCNSRTGDSIISRGTLDYMDELLRYEMELYNYIKTLK
jgi:hypothetical protein